MLDVVRANTFVYHEEIFNVSRKLYVKYILLNIGMCLKRQNKCVPRPSTTSVGTLRILGIKRRTSTTTNF
ncbi:hypothetical protein L6452_14075 [Arctium lappa]|uniref:Uncharacterized protein n=1 Tax=Arctium lappa TaxID=4217 RepID=A0ACB9CJV3_ARCLA|nr:hypothetical protein L6452_14075 [Arctium lappa]